MTQKPEHTRELPIIVIGAGGHAGVLIHILGMLNRRILFSTDSDAAQFGKRCNEVEIRGNDELILDHSPDSIELVNGVGSANVPDLKRAVFERFKNVGYHFASVIHPQAIVSSSAKLGEGVQIMAGAVIQHNVVMGDNTLVNTRASVGHDCTIGRHIHVAPGVTVCGGVRIGDGSHIGAGSTLIQCVKLGSKVLVGAGSLVLRDATDRTVLLGSPARPRVTIAPDTKKSRPAYPIMLSASGRRVGLMRLLMESGRSLDMVASVIAADVSALNPTYHSADRAVTVPPYERSECLEVLLTICGEHGVRLIIPTIDPDLTFYARHLERFRDIGVQIMIGSADTVKIGNDKRRTHQWLVEKGLPTVNQMDADAYLQHPPDWEFPLFVKPLSGSSSIGVATVRDIDELHHIVRNGDYLVQTVAPGHEYTVDVYVDRTGQCRCAVPRLRLETRGGEVTKGVTVRHEGIQDLARRVVESLPGAWGVMNIQIFYDQTTGQLNVIEINPRFGGGYPLTHAAGAHMTRWMIEEAMGLPSTARDDTWQDGLVMLRYDEAVYVTREQAGLDAT